MQLLKNVTVKFNHKLILENVNLNSEAKKIAIIGLNGSGKSTILNLLTNEIMPNEGEIYSIKNATYFFQNFSLFSDLTVNENMQLFIHQNWNETLATQLDLHNFKDKKISQCSDGELQRVIICMAILDSSPILILDEPTKHLDEFHKKLVLNLLHHLDKMIIMAIHEENLNLIDGFEIYEIKNKNLSLIHSTLKNYQAISFHHSFSNNIKAIFKNFIFFSLST